MVLKRPRPPEPLEKGARAAGDFMLGQVTARYRTL